MRISREFTLHEIMDILAEHMGGALVRGYSMECPRGMSVVVKIECETFPEHPARSPAIDWCARELARSRRPLAPDYGAAMWAGIRAARQAADDDWHKREIRAARHLEPLGQFAAKRILAAVMEMRP
ncbi:hypothetical protein [Burkholderia sp. BCC0322]|uniref:hypothetical protein n=1 Tax=unclassified Burkholderia TaxID=2613784 RepID=UPI001588A55E|nr:hypothetical protein [Burkholderia sp. BCC0322]